MNKSNGAIVFSVVILVSIIVAISLAIVNEPTPIIYTDAKGVEVATSNHYSLPEGTIIHKDFGKFWLCVEIDSNSILMRNSGPSSLAVSVDSCNVE